MTEPIKPEGKLDIPPDADKTSKEIAEDLAEEGKAEGGKPEEKPLTPESPETPEKPEKPEEGEGEEAGGEEGKEKKEKKEEGKPEEGGEKPETPEKPEKPEKPQRTPQTMSIYKHKIAEKKWEKERTEKEDEIKRLNTELKKKSSPEKQKVVKDFAEKHGLEPEMVTDLLKIVEAGQPDVAKELDKFRSEIEKGRTEREQTHQYKEFDKDYEKSIVPLLEKDGIPSEKRKEVKKLLQTLAFTTEYSNTPLPVIYRGATDFDEFKVKGKKSAEPSRGGARGGEEGDEMPKGDKEFQEWSDKKGKEQGNRTIERKG